jgi:hypothetical protein
MQNLTTHLTEAVQNAVSGISRPITTEADDFIRIECQIPTRDAIKELNLERLAGALALAEPCLQIAFFDISVLPSHEIKPSNSQWKSDLEKYIHEAQPFEEDWKATVSLTLSKPKIVEKSGLPADRFLVKPFFHTSSLLGKAHSPLKDQLRTLFPDQNKKSVLILLDNELFYDGPFLCITDWRHLERVTYSPDRLKTETDVMETLREECTWRGLDSIYLPEFLEVTQIEGSDPELLHWLSSLKGTLGLFALANVVEVEDKRTQLTFWGLNKRQVVLNGTGHLEGPTSLQARAFYSWVYREIPHRVSGLRISRNLLAQSLGQEAGENLELLATRLTDLLASARANYAVFLEEKLKDFFELQKEIASYVSTDAEYVYKKLRELNDSLSRSVVTTLGFVGGALLSTAAVQINPLSYAAILVCYASFLIFFHVWYVPREAGNEFSEHLRRFRSRLQPYKEYLDASQTEELFSKLPNTNEERFEITRRLVRVINSLTAIGVLLLSGYDIPKVAKSFTFEPCWALGRVISWLLSRMFSP